MTFSWKAPVPFADHWIDYPSGSVLHYLTDASFLYISDIRSEQAGDGTKMVDEALAAHPDLVLTNITEFTEDGERFFYRYVTKRGAAAILHFREGTEDFNIEGNVVMPPDGRIPSYEE